MMSPSSAPNGRGNQEALYETRFARYTAALRNEMRTRRQSLDPAAQREAALRFARNFAHCPLFRRSRHIAFYLANDGELDPALLLQRAWDMGKVCYLPVITPRQSLWFAAYADGDPLVLNRFGIPEPTRPGLALVSARVLDLILTIINT